jgi:hypothetical protein
MRIICLGNSFKEGGRCIAGIRINSKNQYLTENDRPLWIRPISRANHGQIRNQLVSHIKLLDILKFSVTSVPDRNNYQSENAYFDERSIQIVGKINSKSIKILCEDHSVIFGNRGKAIHEDKIGSLRHSLILIKTKQFDVVEVNYDDNSNQPQKRMAFKYNGNNYNLPITDPVFLHSYQSNHNILNGVDKIYLSLSVGICWKSWYYKLVAGVIIPPNSKISTPSNPFSNSSDEPLPF